MSSAFNFNLRGIPAEVMDSLKKEAKRLKTSVNTLILKFIESNLGFSATLDRPIYNDLDHLAGTWSREEAKEFEKSVAPFEKIDEELWNS